MVHNSATATISRDRLISVLGTEIAAADFTVLQDRIQLLTIDPGSTFWHSSDGKPGLYIIVAGKVRLFNRSDKLPFVGAIHELPLRKVGVRAIRFG
jgi:hypothetical protein